MDKSDQTIGLILSRRDALRLLASGTTLATVGCNNRMMSTALAACVARPDQTEGPYFVDELLNRSDIRSDPSDSSVKPGARLDLNIAVTRLTNDGCEPLPGIYVDLWHCDHLGVYSDVSDPGFNTVGKKFLRGYQVTGEDGIARFVTIVPGWYSGRTVHMHFKIRSAPTSNPGFEFTSQLYFDDATIDTIHALEPYAAKGPRTRRNAGDGIYSDGGSQLLVPLSSGDEGWSGTFDIALQYDVAVDETTWSGVKGRNG